jgi:hypothetical protein
MTPGGRNSVGVTFTRNRERGERGFSLVNVKRFARGLGLSLADLLDRFVGRSAGKRLRAR